MVYTSNADVFYKRKKNTYKGKPTTGLGYGYSKSSIGDLLKAFGGSGRAVKLIPALRKRFGGSKTKQQKMRRGMVHQEGSSTSMSSCNFGSGPMFNKDIKKLTAPQSLAANNAGFNSRSTVGAQSFFDVVGLGNTDLVTIKSLAPESPAAASRVFIESYYGEVLMSNASVYTTNVTIYDIIARRDGLSANSGDPANAILHGIDVEGGSATDYQTIGSRPFESELFNQFYKVVQTTRVDIPSGGTHRHCQKWNPRKVLSNALQDESSYGIKDLTIYTLVYFHGQPAHDSTTTTSVSISEASLDVCFKRDIRFRYVEETATDWSKDNHLGTSFAVGAQIVNDLVGQVQDAAGLHAGTLIS